LNKTPNAILSRIKFAATLFTAVGISLLCFGYSKAATLNDLQQQQSEINKNISDKTQESKAKSQEIQQTTDDISRLDSDISEIEAKISDTENKISQTQNDISTKQEEIIVKENELAKEMENQKEAIRVMYENAHTNILEMIIGSNTLSELIDHSSYLESLENKIETTINEVNRIKSELEKEKQELESKKSEYTQLQDQQQAYKYGLDEQKNQKNKLLTDAESQKKDLETQIAEAKQLGSQVESQINSIFASMKSDSRTVTARDRGTSAVGFMWPMDYKYISCYFGESSPFQSFHSGIDLANIEGSPVYAAADGTVTVATDMMSNGSYYGYGKYVIIGHNAKYASLYGHLMGFTVSAGSEVKKGDIIGYEGNTGWSTGPHLHFEIRENGAVVDPMNFLP
jgi:murein DD-endopeptidase MepM/ murein hydrolase activator NlpD